MADLGADGVKFPIELLQQKIEFSPPGFLGVHYMAKLLYVALCSDNLFGNIAPVS